MALLQELLEFQLKNAQSLLALFEQEKDAITQRISSDIEQLAKQKMVMVTTISDTDKRIEAHPDVTSLTEDEANVQLVEQIQTVIRECHIANDVNGQALERAHISFNKLNNILNQSQNKMGMTYSADGQTKSISTLGTNIKA
ncbi:flagella synthesis protein FlgN [Vibrio sp. RC27]